MYCPSCGIEERGPSKFCRGCGTELDTVRSTIRRADAITDSAANARHEIGRALAAKIAEVNTARELEKISEEILPAIEKFLESPEERRLRQCREGVLTTVSGLGVGFFSKLIYVFVHDAQLFALIVGGIGVITFLIGLGMVINGVLFTVPRKRQTSKSGSPGERDIATTSHLDTPAQRDLIPPSVTEETTHHLKADSIKSTDPI
jgi:hypothetical protein